MKMKTRSIRSFIGAKDFSVSRAFYRAIGFAESVISPDMSRFDTGGNIGFYLQDAYVEDWVNNTMIFLEVADTEAFLAELRAMGLPEKFPGVRLSGIVQKDWGEEFFLHDPSGVLWHIGSFHAGG